MICSDYAAAYRRVTDHARSFFDRAIGWEHADPLVIDYVDHDSGLVQRSFDQPIGPHYGCVYWEVNDPCSFVYRRATSIGFVSAGTGIDYAFAALEAFASVRSCLAGAVRSMASDRMVLMTLPQEVRLRPRFHRTIEGSG